MKVLAASGPGRVRFSEKEGNKKGDQAIAFFIALFLINNGYSK